MSPGIFRLVMRFDMVGDWGTIRRFERARRAPEIRSRCEGMLGDQVTVETSRGLGPKFTLFADVDILVH